MDQNMLSELQKQNYRNPWQTNVELEQLERLRSEDTPRRLMITHTIGSHVKKIIDLELKTLQSRHDFQSQGQMTLKI